MNSQNVYTYIYRGSGRGERGIMIYTTAVALLALTKMCNLYARLGFSIMQNSRVQYSMFAIILWNHAQPNLQIFLRILMFPLYGVFVCPFVCLSRFLLFYVLLYLYLFFFVCFHLGISFHLCLHFYLLYIWIFQAVFYLSIFLSLSFDLSIYPFERKKNSDIIVFNSTFTGPILSFFSPYDIF